MYTNTSKIIVFSHVVTPLHTPTRIVSIKIFSQSSSHPVE